jgi:hypothetical protein
MEKPHIRRLKNARPGIAEIDAWCQVLHGELAAELHTNGSAMSVPWTVFAAKQPTKCERSTSFTTRSPDQKAH